MCLGPVLINLLHVIYKGHLPNPLAGLFHLGLASHPASPATGPISHCACHPISTPSLLSSFGDHIFPLLYPTQWPHWTPVRPHLQLQPTHPNLVPGTRIGSGRQTLANTCVSNSGPAYTTLGSQGLNSALTCLF